MGIATALLVGSKASNAVTSAASSASSAWNGLSTAGKISAVGTGLTGLLGVVGNVMSVNSAGMESNATMQEGELAYQEALLEADRTAEQGRQFQAEQKMKYVMSGVMLAGSPIMVLDDTANKVQDEINAIKQRGEAQRAVAYARAGITKSEGRTGFLSGLVNTGTNMFSLYNSAKKGGLFDSVKNTSSTVKNGTMVDSNAFDKNLGYA